MTSSTFAVVAIALYVGHHVGDYWVQTDSQAKNKGTAGLYGRWACISHVSSYCITQIVCLVLATVLTETAVSPWATWAGISVSGVTHYMADRREYGLMFKLAKKLGKENFLYCGTPRPGKDDNPTFTTGAWALDQSWHLFFGVFIPALLMAVL